MHALPLLSSDAFSAALMSFTAGRSLFQPAKRASRALRLTPGLRAQGPLFVRGGSRASADEEDTPGRARTS